MSKGGVGLMSDLQRSGWEPGPATAEAARIHDLEAQLAQSAALLREFDHRVKNNLQLISSLMLLQSRRLADDSARSALKSTLDRVTAVATVHRRLYRGADPHRFEFADFVRDLAEDLAGSAGRDDVQIVLDLHPATIPNTSAAPFGLVVNELICNALKHAFPANRAGRITVGVTQVDEVVTLVIADDGVGMGDSRPDFGLTIVDLLCRQLHADVDIVDAQPGVRAVIRAPRRAR